MRWRRTDGRTAVAEVDLGRARDIGVVRIQEDIAGGRDVARWAVQGEVNGRWRELARRATIGYRRRERLTPLRVRRLRVVVGDAVGVPRPLATKRVRDTRITDRAIVLQACNRNDTFGIVRHSRALLAAMIAALAGCDRPAGPGECPSLGVNFGVDSVNVVQGALLQLTPALTCAGTALPGAVFAFTSSDTAVVSVSVSGAVTARAGGRALVSAMAHGHGATLPVVVIGHPEGIVAASVSLPGRPFGVAISVSGIVHVTRYDSLELGRYQLPALTPLNGPPVGASALDVTPVGDRVAVSIRDQRKLTVLGAATGSLYSIPLGGRALRVLGSADGSRVFATTDEDSVYRIDVAAGAITGRLRVPSGFASSGLNGIALTGDGATLLVASMSGTVWWIDLSSFTVTGSLADVYGTAQEVLASQTGDTLFVAVASPPYGVYLFNRLTGAYLMRIPLGAVPFAMRASPDDARLLVTAGSRLYVVSRASLTVTDSVALPGGTARRIAFDRYGRLAVVASDGDKVHLIR